MRRRLCIALVAWLGLLWVASPAIACARAGDRDCCPSGVGSPCNGGEGSGSDLNVLAALCCVSTPAASPNVVADTARTKHVQPHDAGSPDPVVTVAWFATLASHYTRTDAPADITFTRTDAALTYLRTLRLRL